jgi:hypothetical protein
MSEASLAISFELPMPTEPVTPPVATAMRALSWLPIAVTPATDRSCPGWVGDVTARSTYASSIDTGSTSGDSCRRSAMTTSEVRR